LEDRHEIQELLAGADMVFITAGMGGGTGTGGASVVAQIARELGALTVAVVTKPFAFEGKRRRKHADIGVSRLRECVDTLITIPNQRLLQVASPQLSMIDAFKMADEVLVNAVRGISDIINIPGMVNVDFADVKTVMSCMGQALMGIGAASGEGRAVQAARQAICSPLLEDIDIEGATGILVNITAGSDLALMEVNEACSIIQEAAHEDANFIFGTVIDESLGGQLRVTVIATGFPVDKEEIESDPGGKTTQPPPFASRLTTPGLVTAPASKPAARVAPQPSTYAPLTSKRPEALRPRTPEARPEAETLAGAVRDPSRSLGLSDPALTREGARSVRPAAPVTPAVSAQAPLATPVAPVPVIAVPVKEPALGTDAARSAPRQPLPSVDPNNEAAELTRWTLTDEPFSLDDPIPSLAAEPQTLALTPEPTLAPEPRLEGASAQVSQPHAAAPDVGHQEVGHQEVGHQDVGHHDVGHHQEETIAESVFVGDEAPASLQGDDDFLLAESPAVDARAGAVRETAPLETFFDGSGTFITSDIDRKIDEALELAERMRAPRKTPEVDDLDVPAFLRNGMKDLPLD
jgi:cell division protein FtsZ